MANSFDTPLRVGLAGLGTVGGGLAELLQKNAALVRRRTGRGIELKRVLVRDVNKPRSVELPEGCRITANPADLTDDPDIDVLVELMGGIDAPLALVSRALKNGKHVVTANKALLAVEGGELMRLAREKNLILRYEASVAGAVPIIEALRGPLAGNRISSVLGILNGTSNYILSEMTTKGVDFEQALKKAQELGYAEANPTLDIDGQDAAHKLTLLIRLAFGVDYPFTVLPVQGIRGMAPQDIAMARMFGYRVKLVAGSIWMSPTTVPSVLRPACSRLSCPRPICLRAWAASTTPCAWKANPRDPCSSMDAAQAPCPRPAWSWATSWPWREGSCPTIPALPAGSLHRAAVGECFQVLRAHHGARRSRRAPGSRRLHGRRGHQHSPGHPEA